MTDVPVTRQELVERAKLVREQIRSHEMEVLAENAAYFELGRAVFTILFDGDHNAPKLADNIFGDYNNPVSRECVDAVFVLARCEGFTQDVGKKLIKALCAAKNGGSQSEAVNLLTGKKVGLNQTTASSLIAPLTALLA